MEPYRYRCELCDNTYKNKSSLKRHTNSAHFHRRYVCGKCNKEYIRNIDFLKHKIKCNQPLILEQNSENISNSKPSTSTNSDRVTMKMPIQSTSKYDSTKSHTIEVTTKLLSSPTNWHDILLKALEITDSENDSPKICSRTTNTEIHKNPSVSTEVNTSPLCIADMDQPTQIYLNSHNAPSNIKEFLTIKPKPTTQVGCIPLFRQKEGSTQTDKPTKDCLSCKNEEHLIMQRQAYIHIDAVRNLLNVPPPPKSQVLKSL